MTIEELTEKVKEYAKNQTREERLALLQKAFILDKDGNLDKRFFRDSQTSSNSTK